MTPSMYGSFALTAGALASQQVDQTAQQVRLTNDSPYDLWVSFGVSRPAIPSPLSSAGAYSQVIQAWSSQVVPVPGPYPNTSWNGTIWYLAVNYGGLAPSGTTSSRAQLYITAYQAGDPTGTNHAVTRQADLTSQARVIAIPTEPHVHGSYAASFTTLTATDLGVTIYNGAAFSGSQPVTVYTYGFTAALLGTRWAYMQLLVSEFNAGGSITAGRTIAIAHLRSNNGSQPLLPTFAFPLQFTPAATTTKLGYAALINAGWPLPSGTVTALIYGDIYADIDLTGQTPPPAIGNGAGTPSSAVY